MSIDEVPIVQKLLNHAVRARLARPPDTQLTALVQIGTKAHKMDRHRVRLALPDVRDGLGVPVDLEVVGEDQTARAKLLEELRKPPLARLGLYRERFDSSRRIMYLAIQVVGNPRSVSPSRPALPARIPSCRLHWTH